ncbi:type II secretion system protein [bacterium]|nr:type II secretion system protein [bacterium]
MKISRAFTLIELLAVMVILGVLLTLLAPAAMAVKRQTTLATSSSALRQLSIAAQTYLGENNGRFFRSRESLTNGVQWWFGFESSSGPKKEGQRLLDKSMGPLGPYIADSAGNVPDFAFTSMGASFKPKFKNGYFGFGVNSPARSPCLRLAPRSTPSNLPLLEKIRCWRSSIFSTRPTVPTPSTSAMPATPSSPLPMAPNVKSRATAPPSIPASPPPASADFPPP